MLGGCTIVITKPCVKVITIEPSQDDAKAFGTFHECHPCQIIFIKEFCKRLTSTTKYKCCPKYIQIESAIYRKLK
jgi:hypothetical protein